MNSSNPIRWKPHLWKPFDISSIKLPTEDLTLSYSPPPFYGFQPPEETYEVRGILPRAQIIFKDQD